MASRRRSLLLPAILLVLFSGAFLFLSFRFTGADFKVFGDLFAPRKTSASFAILEEIRSMEELETASYDMKVVFPFDFTGDDEVDWAWLKMQYDWSPSQFLAKADPAWYPDGELPREWKYAELYALCRESGIDPGRPDRLFVVLSAGLRAGIDLEAWRNGFSASDPEGDVRGITITEEDGSRILTLAAPPVSITSFTVEDRDATVDGFPDVPLSPEEWGSLVTRLEPVLREMALGGGLPERAEQEGREFITEIFKAAGYDDVRFTENRNQD